MTFRLTEGELIAIQRRQAGWKPAPAVVAPPKPNLVPGGHTKATKRAKKKATPKPRGMNKWEAQFAQTLDYRKAAGELRWWAFEPFRIRLAEDCWYRPDFVTVDSEGATTIYEVKGFMREAARVRLRVAAEKLPYPFYLVKKSKGELRVMPL